jgi:hypothetical protein
MAIDWLALGMGGLGALGGALGGGQNVVMEPFGQDHGFPDPKGIGDWGHIFPPTLLANYLSNIEHAGGVVVARAAQPITLPGTQVQQPGWYGGAGMVAPVGLSAMDVANIRPSILGVPGVRFGEPDPAKFREGRLASKAVREHEWSKWMFPGAPRETPQAQVPIFEKPFSEGGLFQAALPTQQGLRQPGPTPIEPAGGFSELFGALKLLGVETDPMGNLTMGSEYPLFTGAQGPTQFDPLTAMITRCKDGGGDWDGTKCVWPEYEDPTTPLPIPDETDEDTIGFPPA